MSRLPRRLKQIFRSRRGPERRDLSETQAATLRRNLRALLASKESLARPDKPVSA